DRLNTAEKWAAATAENFMEILGASAADEIDDLCMLYALHLQKTSHIILDEYDGSVLNLIESAQGSAISLVETLAQWPTFRDMPYYKNARPVRCLMRAQILAKGM